MAWDRYRNHHLQRRILSIINNTIQTNSSKPFSNVIDIGTGTGDYAYSISSYGHKVVALDNAIGMLKKSKEKYGHCTNIEFVRCDLNIKLPINNEVFDFGICLSVLQTVKNPIFTLSEIHRILNYDGCLILTHHKKSIEKSDSKLSATPHTHCLSKYLLKAKTVIEKLGFLNKYWTQKELINLLQISDFEVLNIIEIDECIVLISKKTHANH